jgi:hypothetical protein
MTKPTILLLTLISLSLPSYAFPPSECTGWKLEETTNGIFLIRKRGLSITSTNEFVDKAERCANALGFTITSFYTVGNQTIFMLRKK